MHGITYTNFYFYNSTMQLILIINTSIVQVCTHVIYDERIIKNYNLCEIFFQKFSNLINDLPSILWHECIYIHIFIC